jgi:CheY-like chemotaxis protein
MLENTKILLVEDDTDFAESLVLAFEDNQNIHIQWVSSGEAAVEQARVQRFDLIVMDVKLPGMSGVEATIEIRSFGSEAEFVLITGYSPSQLPDLKQEDWVILQKPFNPGELLKIIEKH